MTENFSLHVCINNRDGQRIRQNKRIQLLVAFLKKYNVLDNNIQQHINFGLCDSCALAHKREYKSECRAGDYKNAQNESAASKIESSLLDFIGQKISTEARKEAERLLEQEYTSYIQQLITEQNTAK